MEYEDNISGIYTPGNLYHNHQDFLRVFQQSGSFISSKQRNKEIRAFNGNRENRGIRLAHLNAGSAHLARGPEALAS